MFSALAVGVAIKTPTLAGCSSLFCVCSYFVIMSKNSAKNQNLNEVNIYYLSLVL